MFSLLPVKKLSMQITCSRAHVVPRVSSPRRCVVAGFWPVQSRQPEKRLEAAHMVAPLHQVCAEVRADEPRASRHQHAVPLDPGLGLDFRLAVRAQGSLGVAGMHLHRAQAGMQSSCSASDGHPPPLLPPAASFTTLQ